MRLNSNELGIMKFLWEAPHPVSRGEIINGVTDRSWIPESFHLFINKLLKKGAVKVDGYVSDSERHGRTYAPAITHDEYAAAQLADSSVSFSALVAAWTKNNELSLRELEECAQNIRLIIDEMQEK